MKSYQSLRVRRISPVNCPPSNCPLEDCLLSGGASNVTEGQLGCSQHYVICLLLAMIFEGAIVKSDIHGREIGGNLPGGNSPWGNLPGGGWQFTGGKFSRGKFSLYPIVSRDFFFKNKSEILSLFVNMCQNSIRLSRIQLKFREISSCFILETDFRFEFLVQNMIEACPGSKAF